MGNRRNKRKSQIDHRLLPSVIKKRLHDSDKGSYYSDWFSEEFLSEEDDTLETSLEEEGEHIVTASERKLLAVQPTDHDDEMEQMYNIDNEEVEVEGNRILDISLISAALQMAAKCSVCNSTGLSLKENPNSRKGWSSIMYLFCPDCKNKTSFSTSRHTVEDKRKSTVINR